MMTKTTLIAITLLLFSANIFSQEEFIDDLDSLFLKSGEIKIGKVNYEKKEIEFCSDKRNCIDYKFSDVEAITFGHNKEQKRAKAKKGMPLKYRKEYLIQFLDGEYAKGSLDYSGQNYDFYGRLVTQNIGNDFRVDVYTLITNHNEKEVIYWYRRRNTKEETFDNVKKMFKKIGTKCAKIEELDKDRKLRKLSYNLHEIIDNCDLTATPKGN